MSRPNRMHRSFLLACLLFTAVACGQEESNPPRVPVAKGSIEIESDTAAIPLFDEVMAFAREERLHERPLGEIMVSIGEWFVGKPYVAGTLDKSPVEQLVVKLDGFDCVTFVETALALSRGIRDQDYSYDAFTSNLVDLRYRGEKMDGYCSRLHYFSEWIADNEARGQVVNITAELRGIPLEKKLDFMSTHRESYPRLVEDDSLFAGIVEMEKRIESLKLFYIPQDRIRDAYPDLRSGDIVALATDIAGLDVAHTGLVYRVNDGSVGLLHASTIHGVTVSPDLQDYVENNRRQIGIVVARAN